MDENNQQLLVLGAAAVAGFVFGFMAERNLAKNRIADGIYEEVIVEEETCAVSESFFADLTTEEPVQEEPTVAIIEPVSEEPIELVTVNLLENNGWDYETELQDRTPDRPYIIHQDEFFEESDKEDSEFTSFGFTYYAIDNVLVDEQEDPVANQSRVVGDLIFGHGSNDSNIVYIRNEVLKAQYCITRANDSFAESLAYEDESDIPVDHVKIRKFRDE